MSCSSKRKDWLNYGKQGIGSKDTRQKGEAMKRKGKDFCIQCRREVEYKIKTVHIHKTILGKKYSFKIFRAVCQECHGKVSLPDLIDLNVKKIEEQYYQYKETEEGKDDKHDHES